MTWGKQVRAPALTSCTLVRTGCTLQRLRHACKQHCQCCSLRRTCRTMKLRPAHSYSCLVLIVCTSSQLFVVVQNTEAEAHEQMSYALDHGINFLDTAEMYPVPPAKDTQARELPLACEELARLRQQCCACSYDPDSRSNGANVRKLGHAQADESLQMQGLTEKYIGNWLKSQKREDVVLASKVRAVGLVVAQSAMRARQSLSSMQHSPPTRN
jgi:predicted aldo/keto reductase-like oxidoreductase